MFFILFQLAKCLKRERSPTPDKIPDGRYCVLDENNPSMIYGAGEKYDTFYAMWMQPFDKLKDIAIDYRDSKARFSLNNNFGWKFAHNSRLAYGEPGWDKKRSEFRIERLNKSDNNHVIKNYKGECLRLQEDKYSVFQACGPQSTRYIILPECNLSLLEQTVKCLKEEGQYKYGKMQCLAFGGPKPIIKHHHYEYDESTTTTTSDYEDSKEKCRMNHTKSKKKFFMKII